MDTGFAFIAHRLAALVPLIMLSLSGPCGAAGSQTSPAESTTGFWEELHRPAEPYQGPPRSGKQVYAYRCGSCHGRATQGAPMPGDDVEWGMRARKGMSALMEHAVKGYNRGLMPPRGGCGNCSDSELRAAVGYMLGKSGIPPEMLPPKGSIPSGSGRPWGLPPTD